VAHSNSEEEAPTSLRAGLSFFAAHPLGAFRLVVTY